MTDKDDALLDLKSALDDLVSELFVAHVRGRRVADYSGARTFAQIKAHVDGLYVRDRVYVYAHYRAALRRYKRSEAAGLPDTSSRLRPAGFTPRRPQPTPDSISRRALRGVRPRSDVEEALKGEADRPETLLVACERDIAAAGQRLLDIEAVEPRDLLEWRRWTIVLNGLWEKHQRLLGRVGGAS